MTEAELDKLLQPYKDSNGNVKSKDVYRIFKAFESKQSAWQPIETAPRDGTPFYCRIDGLPYLACYDELGRFVWCNHSDVGVGTSYRGHTINGIRLLEQIEEAKYNYQKQWNLWKKGFDHKPTHWMPLPEPPKEAGE